MGVPWIRAVLRAAFAARRKARPTAAANFSVSFFTLVRFMDLFLKYEDCDQNYHTRSKRRRKACKTFRSCSSSDRSAGARRHAGHYARPALLEPRYGGVPVAPKGDAGRQFQCDNQPLSNVSDG